MIISQTPLRMSFGGGGTDLPAFSSLHGGAVVSATIDKWVRVVVSPRFDGDVRVAHTETEIVPHAGDVRHELIRAAMTRAGVVRGVDVLTLADVPSRGTGLGSSSALTVGLLHALYALRGIARTAVELAEEAAEIEIAVLGKPIGRQDQYAVAVGGLNLIEFPRGGGVRVLPLKLPAGVLERLHSHLLLFFTGLPRGSDEILRAQGQAASAGDNLETMHALRELAYEIRDCLCAGNVAAVGPLLGRSWELKTTAAPAAGNPTVETLFTRAREAGATGGRLLGAGGGGFILLFAPPEAHPAVRDALGSLRAVPFRFAARGTAILPLGADRIGAEPWEEIDG